MFLNNYNVYINRKQHVTNKIFYISYLLNIPLQDLSKESEQLCLNYLLNYRFKEHKIFTNFIKCYLIDQDENNYKERKKAANLKHLLLYYNVIDPLSVSLFIEYFNRIKIPFRLNSYSNIISLINSYINYSTINSSYEYKKLYPHLEIYNELVNIKYKECNNILRYLDLFKKGYTVPLYKKKRNIIYKSFLFKEEEIQQVFYYLKKSTPFYKIEQDICNHFLSKLIYNNEILYKLTYPFITHFLINVDKELYNTINIIKKFQNINFSINF